VNCARPDLWEPRGAIPGATWLAPGQAWVRGIVEEKPYVTTLRVKIPPHNWSEVEEASLAWPTGDRGCEA
jgi:hypothetical protein